MKRARLSLAVMALAVSPAAAFLPSASASASAMASVSTVICHGTSLVQGTTHHPGVHPMIRVPTVSNGHPSQWACNLLPSSQAGLVPVERLQIDLNDCYNAGLSVDGEYGPLTQGAVSKVQSGEPGVRPDGDYGPKTIRGGFRYQEAGEPAGICTTIAGS